MIVEIIPTRRPSIVVLVKPNMKFSDRKTTQEHVVYIPAVKIERNWVLPQTRVFYLTPILLQPNVGDLRYFKLWIGLDQIIQVWNIKGCHHRIETI